MPDLEITVFNQKIKLSYQENEKERLINAVEILNQEWNKFSDLHGKVSDIKIVTLISLELQDKIEDFKFLKNNFQKKKQEIEKLKTEIEKKNSEIINSIKTVKNYKLDLIEKNNEILKIEKLLDEVNNELLEIKDNLIKKNHE